MQRKRLKHVADAMCQIFCGWRLNTSLPSLVKLGSGILEIDSLTGQCFFNGEPTTDLAIAQELRLWVQGEVANNKIPAAGLLRARLTIGLQLSDVPWNDRGLQFFFTEGKSVRTEGIHHCRMECGSDVATDEAIYKSNVIEIREWPHGWPSQ